MSGADRESDELLHGHPDVAVVAVPNPVLIERAAIRRAAGQPEEDVASLAFYMDSLNVARQKYPERIEIVDDPPRGDVPGARGAGGRRLVAPRVRRN